MLLTWISYLFSGNTDKDERIQRTLVPMIGGFMLPGGLLMSITVRIPSPLRQYTEQMSEIRMEGQTVGEVLENFKVRFPDADSRFFSTRTARFMNLYLNDQDVRSLKNMETTVHENDTLSIVFAIAGG